LLASASQPVAEALSLSPVDRDPLVDLLAALGVIAQGDAYLGDRQVAPLRGSGDRLLTGKPGAGERLHDLPDVGPTIERRSPAGRAVAEGNARVVLHGRRRS